MHPLVATAIGAVGVGIWAFLRRQNVVRHEEWRRSHTPRDLRDLPPLDPYVESRKRLMGDCAAGSEARPPASSALVERKALILKGMMGDCAAGSEARPPVPSGPVDMDCDGYRHRPIPPVREKRTLAQRARARRERNEREKKRLAERKRLVAAGHVCATCGSVIWPDDPGPNYYMLGGEVCFGCIRDRPIFPVDTATGRRWI